MAFTSNKLVSDVRNIATSGSNPIEFKIEDAQILFWCLQIRAMLISQSIQKTGDILEIWLQTLSCLELVQVDKSECCEIDTGCMILRTVEQIPEIIETVGDVAMVKVTTPKGDIIPSTNHLEDSYSKYTKYTSNKRRYFHKNGYIYITNEDFLSHINITAVFEDPTELLDFVGCDGDTCFNWDSPFPCSLKMANDITNIVLKTKVYPFLQLSPDNTNDANNTTTPTNTKNL